VNLPIHHGGDPSNLRLRLGLGDAPLLDFSTCLNPLGPPPTAIDAARQALEYAGRHPVPGSPRLVERLAEYHKVPRERVIVGAGTTELLGLIGQSLREVLAYHAQALGDPSRPLSHLVDPTYAEYRRVSKHNELRAKVWGEHVLGWEQDVLPRDANGIFWTGHPDNPTGRAWDRATLTKFVDETLGLLTVVNESSLPFFPDEAERTMVGDAGTRENLLVLRSFSNFYAIPGLRVGYAIAPPDMVTRIRQYQDPWTVAYPAEAAALAALDDVDYRQRSVTMLAEESKRLVDRLWDIPGLRPAWPDRVRPDSAPPLPNFVLVSLTQTDWDSIRLQEALATRGLFVRECSDFPGLEVGALLTGTDQLVATRGQIRVAVRNPVENDRLLAELTDLLESGPTDRSGTGQGIGPTW
jgi:threonine-phosphate decarboxylase